jgi:hypothetical protein
LNLDKNHTILSPGSPACHFTLNLGICYLHNQRGQLVIIKSIYLFVYLLSIYLPSIIIYVSSLSSLYLYFPGES